MKTAPNNAPGAVPAGRRVWRVLGRLLLIVVLLAVVVGVMVWLLGTFAPKLGTRPVEVAQGTPIGNAPLVAVRKVTVTDTEAVPGKITPVHEAEVGSQIMEKIVAVEIKAGQPVKKGDVLVRLDDTVLKSRLQQAEANLAADTASADEARAEAGRVRELTAKGFSSKSDLDHAEAVLKAVEAKVQGDRKSVAEAEATLRFATILAPMDGVVIDKRCEAGDLARPGQVLVTIYDKMQVLAGVRESLIGRLKEGQKLTVEVERPRLVCQGTVSEIVPEGDPVARTFPVKVVGPCQPGVRKGMYAKLLIPLDQQELLVIPPSAVTRIGQLDMVDVAEGGSLHRRTVQLGRTLTVDKRERVQVLAGLREGEQVADPALPGSDRTAP